MTVYLPKGRKTWVYDFEYQKRRYHDTTHQTRKDDALQVEAALKLKLRQQKGGIANFDPEDTPTFTVWAGTVLKYQKRFTERPDLVKRALDVVLEFWGAKPARPKKKAAVERPLKVAPPYHDLRLGDPIADSSWLLKFQEWVERRGVSGSTRNTYLSTMSTFYRVALEPEYRKIARVESNPFLNIRRSPTNKRVIALEPEVVLGWIGALSYHAALAATIAALAPKMRLQTILELEWREHFDRRLERITIYKHKTAGRVGTPQVTPVSQQLQEILAFEHNRSDSSFVITYHGEPVQSIKTAVKRGAKAAGLKWGVADGVTFHTLRHSIATLLADLGLSEAFRKELLGHKEIRTTQQYTHLAARSQVAPHEALSAAMPLRELVLAKGNRLKKKSGMGKPPGLVLPGKRKQAHIRALTSAPARTRSGS